MSQSPDALQGLRETFIWNYVARCPLIRGETLVVFLVVAFGTQLPRGTPLHHIFLAMFALVGLLLVLNYLAWLSFGRLLTTKTERLALTNRERAELAWKFWWRPARKPKS